MRGHEGRGRGIILTSWGGWWGWEMVVVAHPHLWESVDRDPISVDCWPAQRSTEAMVVLAEASGYVGT